MNCIFYINVCLHRSLQAKQAGNSNSIRIPTPPSLSEAFPNQNIDAVYVREWLQSTCEGAPHSMTYYHGATTTTWWEVLGMIDACISREADKHTTLNMTNLI